MKTRTLFVRGILADDFTLSHVCMGEQFYRSRVKVHRKSGKADYLPVVVSGRLDPLSFIPGDKIEIMGQFRSYNQKVDDCHIHLALFCFADVLRRCSGDFYEPINSLSVCGYLCKPARYRRSPNGRELCDVLLAVDRECGKSDYLPLVFWGSNARAVSALSVGDELDINGRIQSRVYYKDFVPREAYEVSVDSFKKCE